MCPRTYTSYAQSRSRAAVMHAHPVSIWINDSGVVKVPGACKSGKSLMSTLVCINGVYHSYYRVQNSRNSRQKSRNATRSRTSTTPYIIAYSVLVQFSRFQIRSSQMTDEFGPQSAHESKTQPEESLSAPGAYVFPVLVFDVLFLYLNLFIYLFYFLAQKPTGSLPRST